MIYSISLKDMGCLDEFFFNFTEGSMQQTDFNESESIDHRKCI